MNPRKQYSISIEKTIKEIKSKQPVTDKRIAAICNKNNVNEAFVIKIAGYRSIENKQKSNQK
jgi:hypothetical protein